MRKTRDFSYESTNSYCCQPIETIEEKYGIEISNYQKRKIDKVFTEIGKILNQVNGTRKRVISVNFILRKVLSMMGIPCEKNSN